jgi:hypothetical protein
MRILKVAALVFLVVALPLVADDKPPIDDMDPDNGDPCVECTFSYERAEANCGGPPSAGGWSNCKGTVVWLCDGSGDCAPVAECGDRCLIA